MSPYASINNHRSMVFDQGRNHAYARAIETAVTPESVVLDLGSGLGLLGLIAARAGARQVYLVDPSPVVQMAARVAKANGLDDRVQVIQSPVESADIPEKVDLIVSVLTGNFLLGEDLLPSLFHARDRFLKPEGRLIPDCAEVLLAPIDAKRLYQREIGCWADRPQEFDYSAVCDSVANQMAAVRVNAEQYEFLAEPGKLMTMDFTQADEAAIRQEIAFTSSRPGICHGVLGWFSMRLGDDWHDTGPMASETHWSQVYFPQHPPLNVDDGAGITFALHRPTLGDWTWTLGLDGRQHRHSTFFSRQFDPKQLRLQDGSHRPELPLAGQVAFYVLEGIREGMSVGEIRAQAADAFRASSVDNALLEEHLEKALLDFVT